MKTNKSILGSENIPSLLFKLAVPSTVGMILMALYNVVDTIFVGRAIGPMGIAAVSLCFPIHMFILSMGLLVGVGGASVLSRSLGALEYKKARFILTNAVVTIITLTVLLAVFGQLFLDRLVLILGATADTQLLTQQYLKIILLGSPFFGFSVSGNNILRAQGFAKTAMTAMAISALMNILLDYIFIFIFEMGIVGAALATIISQFFSALFVFVMFVSGKTTTKLNFKYLVLKLSIIKEILSIGVSAFVRTVIGSLLIVIINNSLKTYGNSLYIAVYGIINRLMTFALMPIFGIGQGFQPIAGYNYGARRFQKVKQAFKVSAITASVISLIGYLNLFFLPKIFVSLFTNDPELFNLTISSIKLFSAMIFLVGFQVIGSIFFQAIGKALPAFLLTTSRQALILTPLILILPNFLGVKGIWISFPISDLLAFTLTVIMVRKQFKTIDKKLSNKKES